MAVVAKNIEIYNGNNGALRAGGLKVGGNG